MKKILVALAMAGLSAPALAQDNPSTPPLHVGFDTSVLVGTDFATLDADASGSVSFEELSAKVPGLTHYCPV